MRLPTGLCSAFETADHQVRHVQGASGDGRARLGMHPGEEADSPVAGTGDVRLVTVRHRDL